MSRMIGTVDLADGCGLAPAPASGVFLLTSGRGGALRVSRRVPRSRPCRRPSWPARAGTTTSPSAASVHRQARLGPPPPAAEGRAATSGGLVRRRRWGAGRLQGGQEPRRPLPLGRILVPRHDALEDGARSGVPSLAEREAQRIAPVEPGSVERRLGQREPLPVVPEGVGAPAGVDLVPGERLAVGIGVVRIERVPDALVSGSRSTSAADGSGSRSPCGRSGCGTRARRRRASARPSTARPAGRGSRCRRRHCRCRTRAPRACGSRAPPGGRPTSGGQSIERDPRRVDLRRALHVRVVLVGLGRVLGPLGEDVAHQHARMGEDRRRRASLEEGEEARVMLERVVALEPVDPAQHLEVARLRVHAETARVRQRIGQGRVPPEPTGLARDRRHLPLDARRPRPRAGARAGRGTRPGPSARPARGRRRRSVRRCRRNACAQRHGSEPRPTRQPCGRAPASRAREPRAGGPGEDLPGLGRPAALL